MATLLSLATVCAEGSSLGTRASGTITFTNKPTSGDRITIYSTGQYDFFYKAAAANSREITIGSLISNSVYNTIDAINHVKAMEITASLTDAATHVVGLQKNRSGTMFNVNMVPSAGVPYVLSGMASGTNGGDPSDATRTSERYIALAVKTDGTFCWDYTGYMGIYKFVTGLCVTKITNLRDWNDIKHMSDINRGRLVAYELSAAEYAETAANIKTAIENA